MARAVVVVACAIAILPHAACARSPSAPSASASLRGTWVGTIAGEGVGTGALTLTIADEYGAAPLTRVAGDWTTVFTDARFSGRGTFSGGPHGTSEVVLNFSAMVVACPGQPGGIATKSPIVTLAHSDRRLTGRYIALDCLGGEMSVSRR